MLKVRPAAELGPVGLILPTLPQNTGSGWATHAGSAVADAVHGSADAAGDPIKELSDLCREAETLGASALWACDHLFWHGPVLECMTALTVAATATQQAMLGSCVIQLPLRQPTTVAKQAASLQMLSGGRFVLGVGVGSHIGEYDQVGIDFHTRGRRLDDGIAEVRRAWRSGERCDSEEDNTEGSARYRQLPAPPAVPIWVGGSSEAALRRAATTADGWMPLFLDPAEYTGALERLAKEIDKSGRPSDAVTRSMVLFVSVDDDVDRARRRGTEWMSGLYGIPAKAFQRHLIAGTATEVAETVATYRRSGAEHVVLYMTDDEPLDQFGQLVEALRHAGIDPRP